MALVVGIDIGRNSPHDVIILCRESGVKVNSSFRFRSTCQGIDNLLEKVEKAREGEEDVSFVIDSPGRAWVPVAAALKGKGYNVYRPPQDKVKVLRRATNGKNKTNRIDATTLARSLIINPEGTGELFLLYCQKGNVKRLGS